MVDILVFITVSRHNFFTQVNQLVSDFIIRINKNNNLIAKEFDKLIASINPKDHNLLFEMIDMRISEINNQEGVFYYLLTNYNKYEDEQRFFELNSSDKAQILLATVIKNNNAK